MMIYDLIEAVSRYQLKDTRERHETDRLDLFKTAFCPTGSGEKRQEYMQTLMSNVEDECVWYKPAQTMVLDLVKVNNQVWEESMDVYLPGGELFLRTACTISLSSPYTYKGDRTPEGIMDVYKSSVEFGLKEIAITADETHFGNILRNDTDDEEFEQTRLIIMDYLVTD